MQESQFSEIKDFKTKEGSAFRWRYLHISIIWAKILSQATCGWLTTSDALVNKTVNS